MDTDRMPVIFIGHGSPMNALLKNEYTEALAGISARVPEPEAVLVISAHWLTGGTKITSGSNPEQIYDFYGFPEELYSIVYRPPGSQEIAGMISDAVTDVKIVSDEDRGIDHAAWAVLRHIYPDQNVPVLELSLDLNASPDRHYNIGRALSVLRGKGILIIGSGNIVHNLPLMHEYEGTEPRDWAVEFDGRVKKCLLENDHASLIGYEKWGRISKYSVPTDEHYNPMLYISALKQDHEKIDFIHESFQYGTISMRSFIIG